MGVGGATAITRALEIGGKEAAVRGHGTIQAEGRGV